MQSREEQSGQPKTVTYVARNKALKKLRSPGKGWGVISSDNGVLILQLLFKSGLQAAQKKNKPYGYRFSVPLLRGL